MALSGLSGLASGRLEVNDNRAVVQSAPVKHIFEIGSHVHFDFGPIAPFSKKVPCWVDFSKTQYGQACCRQKVIAVGLL